MYISLGILGIILILFIYGYNTLIRLRNTVKESFSSIEVQLKRRYNLIPNLVESVKGYATHEKDTLTKITNARKAAMKASKFKDQVKAENEITDTLKSLFAVSENYPNLKANENFLQLQEELSDTEDKISASRRFYNGAVKSYNTKIESIPTNLIAGLFKFKKEEFWKIKHEEERENIKVDTKI